MADQPKTYSSRSNCIAGARNDLAKTGIERAEVDVHFTLAKDETTGTWSWALVPPTPTPTAAAPMRGEPGKTAVLIAMLKEGATVSQIMAKTGWLPHTTRAALTMLKKHRGITVTSAKPEKGAERVYQIA